jgi:hypothetical protein
MQHACQSVREITTRERLLLPVEEIVVDLVPRRSEPPQTPAARDSTVGDRLCAESRLVGLAQITQICLPSVLGISSLTCRPARWIVAQHVLRIGRRSRPRE